MDIGIKCAAYSPRDSFTEKSCPSYGSIDTHYGKLCMISTGVRGSSSDIVAGRITFEIIRRVFTSVPGRTPDELFRTAVEEANTVLYGMHRADLYPHGFGADLAAMLIETNGSHMGTLCNAGSSMIYRIRNGSATLLTGERQMPGLSCGPGLTSGFGHSGNGFPPCSIGREEFAGPQIERMELERGDRYVLASRIAGERMKGTDLGDIEADDPRIYAEKLVELLRDSSLPHAPVVQVVQLV